VPYCWNDGQDVDEAVVVVMNTLEADLELQKWLLYTLQQAIENSDPELAQYFFVELKRHRPEALGYFEKPVF